MKRVFKLLRDAIDNDNGLNTNQKRALTDATNAAEQNQAVTWTFTPSLSQLEDADASRPPRRSVTEADLRGIAACLVQARLHAAASYGDPYADTGRSWVFMWSFQKLEAAEKKGSKP
jgi:hypothetical protein